MKKVRNYDRRVKQTRIFLADYFVVRELSQQAGISMAEALHKLLVGRIPAIQPALKVPIARVALRYASQPAKIAPVAITRRRSTPVIIGFSREVENVTNGHRRAD